MRIPTVVVCVLVLVAATPAAPTAVAAVSEPTAPATVTNAPQTPTTVPDSNTTAGTDTDPTAPRIVGLLPNPVADDDAGEYLRLSLPPGNWSVDDGEDVVAIRQRRAGTVVVTGEPEAPSVPTSGRVVARGLALSNAGERIVLRRGGPNGSVVDAVEYGRAPEGERWGRNEDPRWRPVGLELRDPVALGAVNATAFVLPDAPGEPVAPIQGADERVFLAGYTFASERVAEELIAAHERGATVRVLLDGGPVGGVTTRQAALLDSLVAAGVEVRVIAGPHARFRYHHAKYAVADDAAVVLTENWKPSGTGGGDSRGWGVTVRSPRAADALADLFRADAGWRDAVPWERYRAGRSFERTDAATGSYPSRHPPTEMRVERVRLLTAPGNAESAVVATVDDADTRVDVLQPTVDDGPMLASLRRAAERGVRVRLLLSSAWYLAEENAALVADLNRWADAAGVPLEARVAEPAGRYGKIHAKGVVADDTALVGSLNWNPTSARENREVVVALEGEAVAEYYRGSFAADWRGGRGRSSRLEELPPAVAIVAVGVVAAATLFLRRRLTIEDTDGEPSRDDTDRDGPIG
ncbi:phospholipase D-like domain-containing protein [Halobaculum rubrum]|uniref:phospholipase D-like domain-containing protein n=1 Tax=Halobaculum rubrum TaxID=2872158 RepID=UPI001CA44D45|nr:phospholipase D-like domain-containing protein [Halobaculum rubrum]QZX99498.1 phospholipase [Halobaculum rubrum]